MIHKHPFRLALWICFLTVTSCAPSMQRAARAPVIDETKWRGPFFFIQMSDPQFGLYANNQNFTRETELYDRAIAAANQLKPAFVIITGDLINKAGHPEQLAELKRISAKLDKSIPLYLIPGNHDVENIPTPASLAAYRQNIGKDYYSFDFAGCHFTTLNSTILLRPDVPDEMSQELAWLKQDVESSAARKPMHSFVLMHHPLFVAAAEEPDSGNAIPKVRRKPIIDLLMANHVLHVFTGHLHRNAAGKFGELEAVSTGPVGRPNGTDVSGFRIVKVYQTRIEHEYVPLDKVPEKVTIDSSATASR